MTVLVLGDQLNPEYGPVADADRVLLIEASAFARRHAYHPHKLTLVFSAMRHFRDHLSERGIDVEYHRCTTFAEGFDAHFEAFHGDDLVVMKPASHGRTQRLVELVESRGGTLDVVENDLFLIDRATWNSYAVDRDPPYRHEQFYRTVRRETGYLMADGEPVGGEWNYDEENRQSPPDDYTFPEPPRYEPDSITTEVSEWVRETFAGPYTENGHDWTDQELFFWPATREQALDALDRFVEDRLAEFGPYQDAMLEAE